MTSQSPSAEARITNALQNYKAEYEQKHPESKKAFERAQKVLPAGSTRSVLVSEPFPLVVQSAQGPNFTTVDGLEYVDFVSDYSAGIYGHSHPVIHDAVNQALATGFSLGGITQKEAELAEILTRRFPSLEKVRFCNSGTEANTFAIATAMAYTKKKKIMVFDNGYHGGTLSFGSPDNPMNLPHRFVLGKYNSVEETRPLIEDDIAAILIEPMQAAGGMRPATPEFLSFLRQAADRVDAILIFDEVVTSRLHYHGLQGAWGITPDMTTVGKYLGGGFPFGAFGGSARIMDLFDSPDKSTSLHHSGTFNNNIFTMTAAVAASKLITQAELERLNQMGNGFREWASEILRERGVESMSFSGYGSAIGVHFSGDDAEALRDCFYFSLIACGVSIGRRGFMSLNLAHDESSMERLRAAVSSFLDEGLML
ncbi:acetylornithine aminotransferase [Penicillium hispanicum]|uniref:acetylornithine aminotransferase n=1 Tax=Penicillium hispanicum TaxID=1080232 RepID=UPI002541EF91|nr:acetylornithine aminotransferase [Penicillium hispanicum]KAJ5594160.1 acetylornithine aminotransferase [Penicillium hispanicum]